MNTQFQPLQPSPSADYLSTSKTIMPEPVIIDLQAIENLRALNPGDEDAFLQEIVNIFLEDTPQRIAELDQSLTEGDVTRFARAAHSIKGSSANLGAEALRTASEKLEHHARTDGITGVATLLQQVRDEFAKAQAELAKLMRK